ncbi:MAG TPA: transporter substrate-binding domain-containing protein [Chloroflexota bacterium]|nr:transporter substrate-binding domain-containing protein [Chloroflexota bacterium]
MIKLAAAGLAPVLAGLMAWQLVGQPLLNPSQLHLPTQQQVETRLPKLGVHTRLTDEVEQGKIQRTFEMVRQMGAAWDVEYFPWNYIQPNGPNDWDWSHADLVVNHAARQGLKLIVRLDGVPDWARPNLTGHSLLAEDRYPDFARFAAAFAERYQGKVAAYVIWNEPNVDYEWGYRKPDPAGYADLLRAVYSRLKQADPHALVLAAPLAPNGEHSDAALDDLEYLQQLYDAGAAPYFDGLAAHAYGWEHPPEEAPAANAINFRRVELQRQIMVRNGDAAKQVFITESGWNDYARWVRAVSPAQRIEYTLDAVKLASSWDWLAAICLWDFRLPAPAHNYNDAWTMVHFDFSPGPTYVALQRLASPNQPAQWQPFVEQPTEPGLGEQAAASIGDAFDALGHWADSRRYQLGCLFSDCRVPPDISLEQVQQAGVLKVVLDASFPPLETLGPDGKPAGIDVQLAQALAQRLGVTVQITNMSSDGLKDAVWAGKADAIISSFQYVPEWRKELAYSEPYFEDHIPETYGLDAAGQPVQRVDTVDYRVVVRSGRIKLLKAINAALDQMMDSGELERITGQPQWR